VKPQRPVGAAGGGVLSEGCDLDPLSALAAGEAFGSADECRRHAASAPRYCDDQITDTKPQGIAFEDLRFKQAGEKSDNPAAHSGDKESAGVPAVVAE